MKLDVSSNNGIFSMLISLPWVKDKMKFNEQWRCYETDQQLNTFFFSEIYFESAQISVSVMACNMINCTLTNTILKLISNEAMYSAVNFTTN